MGMKGLVLQARVAPITYTIPYESFQNQSLVLM